MDHDEGEKNNRIWVTDWSILLFFRNPKDTCVSFYHFEKLLPVQGLDKDADFEDYWQNFFLPGKLIYGPYWTHLKDAWKYRNEANFKFIWYNSIY